MDMCTRRLTRELQAIQKNPIKSPSILAVPNESNILEWHYVIEGSEGTPYHGGYYHGKLIFPKEYPLKPPSVIMLTPSGRFKPNRRLCLSMSDFHPESWNPMWSVSTILTGLYSFMVETNPTLGSIETSTAQKRRFASESLDFNVRDSNFVKLFPDLVELQKERLNQRRAAAEVNGLAGLSSINDMNSPSGTLGGDLESAEMMKACLALGVAVLSLVVAFSLF